MIENITYQSGKWHMKINGVDCTFIPMALSVLVASENKKSISRPNTIGIPAGFELSNEKEFNTVLNEVLNGISTDATKTNQSK